MMAEDFKVPTLDEVFNAMDTLFRILDMLDHTYVMYENNILMRYYKNRGVSLKSILLHDMADWLCFLGWSDGNIASIEVDFINALLKLDLTQLEIFDIVKKLSAEKLSILPLIFAIFIEYEAVSNKNNEESIVEALFYLFFISGSYLIVCDGNVDDNEIKGLMLYLDGLRHNIDTFDLNSLHRYMIDNI